MLMANKTIHIPLKPVSEQKEAHFGGRREFKQHFEETVLSRVRMCIWLTYFGGRGRVDHYVGTFALEPPRR